LKALRCPLNLRGALDPVDRVDLVATLKALRCPLNRAHLPEVAPVATLKALRCPLNELDPTRPFNQPMLSQR
jgi:hypothetical protein